jgi:hypothetical protein
MPVVITILIVLSVGAASSGIDRAVTTIYRDHQPAELSAKLLVEPKGSRDYALTVDAMANQYAEFVLIVTNTGGKEARNVIAHFGIPSHEIAVCGSPAFVDSNTSSSGLAFVPDDPQGCRGGGVFSAGGQYIDDLAPGASESLYWEAQVVPDLQTQFPVLVTSAFVSAFRVPGVTARAEVDELQ